MATPTKNTTSDEKRYFETQRELLLSDVATSMENVLQNINRLNRSLEGIIAVGNEFGQVESLWSQFEGVMAKESGEQAEGVPDASKHTSASK